MATPMESTGSDILQGRALNSDMRGDALVPGKIPKIVHQGWLKKKGIQIYSYSSNQDISQK